MGGGLLPLRGSLYHQNEFYNDYKHLVDCKKASILYDPVGQNTTTLAKQVSRLRMAEKLKVTMVPMVDIEPNTWNPNVMDEEFNDLVENMDRIGFVLPLLLVPNEKGAAHKYRIVDGEQRFEAAKIHDFEEAPAVVLPKLKGKEYEQMVQTIRMNKIRGHTDKGKFLDLVQNMLAEKTFDEVAEDLLFHDPTELQDMVASARESLPNQEMKDAFDRAKGEIKTVDDLSLVLNRLFCYDEKTETLTDHGWIRWNEYKAGMKVAVFDLESWTVCFRRPEALHVFVVREQEMHRIVGKSTDLLVSPGHRMLYKPVNGTKKGWVVCSIEEMLRRHTKFEFVKRINNYEPGAPLPDKIRISGSTGDPIPVDVFLRFVGWYVSEGGIKQGKRGKPAAGITQQVGEKLEEIKAMFETLRDLGYTIWGPHENSGYVKYYVKDDAFVSWIKESLGEGARNKKLPKELLTLPPEQLVILFETMMKGDGNWREVGKYGSYSTISQPLAKSVQAIAFLLGYKALVFQSGGMWHVSLTRGTEAAKLLKRRNFRTEVYTGIVYCFKVPYGLFVVRRNGRISIHGNTEYGDTLPYNFMILDFGGKDHVWVRLKPRECSRTQSLAREFMAHGVTFDSVLARVMMLMDARKFVEKHRDFLEEPEEQQQVTTIDELTNG